MDNPFIVGVICGSIAGIAYFIGVLMGRRSDNPRH